MLVKVMVCEPRPREEYWARTTMGRAEVRLAGLNVVGLPESMETVYDARSSSTAPNMVTASPEPGSRCQYERYRVCNQFCLPVKV